MQSSWSPRFHIYHFSLQRGFKKSQLTIIHKPNAINSSKHIAGNSHICHYYIVHKRSVPSPLTHVSNLYHANGPLRANDPVKSVELSACVKVMKWRPGNLGCIFPHEISLRAFLLHLCSAACIVPCSDQAARPWCGNLGKTYQKCVTNASLHSHPTHYHNNLCAKMPCAVSSEN